MSVGDLYDIERTGEFAVIKTRVRRPHLARPAPVDRAPASESGGVPITVLTADGALADAIHDAAAGAHPVATATTLDEAVELAAHGRCGVLITDHVATEPVLRRMTQRLREAEPALVVIAIGGTGDQNSLISLLSAGVVDRLMLKPVTPTLARIVLKSAAQQHRTLQDSGPEVTPVEHDHEVALLRLQRPTHDLAEANPDLQPSPAEIVVSAPETPPAKASRRIDIPRPPWIAVVAALLAVAGLIGWMAASQRKPAIDPQTVIASNLAAGQHAFREGHALEPRGRSAFDYYNTVLALDPANTAARLGIEQIADRFAAEAGIAIARGQFAAAIVALESIRRVRPEHWQVRELQAQLDAAQEKYVATAPERVTPASQPAPKAAPAKASVLSTSLQQDVIQARARTLVQAAEALERDQLELASALLREARALGVPAAELEAMDETLASAQQRRAKDELQQLATAEKKFELATRLLPPAGEVGSGGAAMESAESELPAASEPVASEPVEAPAAAAPRLRLARMVRPEYPQDALISGAEGWVNVNMSVTPAGNVLDPRVVESSNAALFNRAAISAVRKWKYEPFAASDPHPVTVRVEFKMKDRR